MTERLRIERKRFKLLEKRSQRGKTLDHLIQKREWVEDGMTGLLRMVKDSWSYFDSLVCLATYQPLSCHQYSWALGYALSTMWILSLNARNGCIERLTMKDYHNIQSKNFHLASDFKTSSKYSYQIVSTTDIVAIFIKYIRRYVITDEIDSDDAVVFPSFLGTPLSPGEGSKKVTSIFRRYGYHITITKLRAMISTHLEDKFHQNEISFEDYKVCVEAGQTHSLATHKKYYVKKRKYDDGEIIRNTHQRVFPQDSELLMVTTDSYVDHVVPSTTINNIEISSTEPSYDIYIPHTINHNTERRFGLARDDLNDVKKRFDWLPEEKEFIRRYVDEIERQVNPRLENRYSKCLSYIKQTAPLEVIQYFHPHHLVNSDRLKNGFEKIKELN